ncbi:MAG: hypothetical protein AABZ74_06325, partial [Cyanobacteriota bacterium]
MSFFDFSSIISNYNPAGVQAPNTGVDKNKYQKSDDKTEELNSQYIEKKRTLEEILAEQGIDVTQRNKEIAKALHKHNQMINAQNIEYVKKVMEQYKFNSAVAYEAYVVLVTSSLDVSQRNLDAVQTIIQDKNVILEVKQLTSKIDELNKIIDNEVENQIKILEADKNANINKDIIEADVTKKIIDQFYIKNVTSINSSDSIEPKVDEIPLDIENEVPDLINNKDISKNEIKVNKLDLKQIETLSKDTVFQDKLVDKNSEKIVQKQDNNFTNYVENENVKIDVKTNSKIENNSLNLDKSIRQEQSKTVNVEIKSSSEVSQKDNFNNFYKTTNQKIADILNNKLSVKNVELNENPKNKNEFVIENDILKPQNNKDTKIEGFEYHLRNTGMSDESKNLLKSNFFSKQETNAEGETVINIFSASNQKPKLSVPLKSIPQDTRLVENQPVFVNIDGKPRLVIRDKTGVKILLVNLDMVKKLLGIIKPESVKLINDNGKSVLVFKDESNQEKSIPINEKILVKENFTQPKIVSKSGEKNILIADQKSGETYLVPAKYFVENSEILNNDAVVKIDSSDIRNNNVKDAVKNINLETTKIKPNSIFTEKQEDNILKNKVLQSKINVVNVVNPNLIENISIKLDDSSKNNQLILKQPDNTVNNKKDYTVVFNDNNVKIDFFNDKKGVNQEIIVDKAMFNKIAGKYNINSDNIHVENNVINLENNNIPIQKNNINSDNPKPNNLNIDKNQKSKVIDLDNNKFLIHNSNLVNIEDIKNADNSSINTSFKPEVVFIKGEPKVIIKSNNDFNIISLPKNITENELNIIKKGNLNIPDNVSDNNKLSFKSDNKEVFFDIPNTNFNLEKPEIIEVKGEKFLLIPKNENKSIKNLDINNSNSIDKQNIDNNIVSIKNDNFILFPIKNIDSISNLIKEKPINIKPQDNNKVESFFVNPTKNEVNSKPSVNVSTNQISSGNTNKNVVNPNIPNAKENILNVNNLGNNVNLPELVENIAPEFSLNPENVEI